MTTIAYKDGIIAYDSQVSSGSTISTLTFNKHKEKDGIHYFLCGAVSDYTKFMNRELNVDCSAIVIEDNSIRILHYNKDDGYFYAILQNQCAIGTGEKFAIGAMDAGATAEQAVKIAKKRDIYTGGKVRIFKL